MIGANCSGDACRYRVAFGGNNQRVDCSAGRRCLPDRPGNTCGNGKRLAEIWTRLGLNAAAPTVNSDAAMTAGGMALAFTVAGSDVICQRTDATHPDPIDPATMILEIWQRLGLDPDNAMTTGDARIEVAGIQMDVSGTDTVTVQRLWGD